MSTTDPTELFRLDPEAIRCPHHAVAAIREESPARWFEELNAFVVTRFDDVMEVLLQPMLFSTRNAGGSTSRASALPVLLTADPPSHTRQRAIVNRAFTPNQVRRLEPVIREMCTELLDQMMTEGGGEFIEQFATPLPIRVIARLLGVPEDQVTTFKRWSTDLVVFVGNQSPTEEQKAAFQRSFVEFNEYFTAAVDERRRAEGGFDETDDLVTRVVNAEIDGDRLSEEEILSMLRQLLLAGNDTSTNLIASCALILAERPELYHRLRAESALIEPFIEEVLRLESPIQGLYRSATADTEVGGVDIPAGSAVLVMYAGANRDPRMFDDPDQLRTDREQPRGHLAFGHGTHVCLGASLARAEARITWEVITERVERLVRRSTDVVRYEPSFMLRGLDRLDLDLIPG